MYIKQKIKLIKARKHIENQTWDQDYDNLFGIGIPDIFMNMLSCHGFINNNDSIVILKCPNQMSQYYFNKVFTELKCDEEHLKKILI